MKLRPLLLAIAITSILPIASRLNAADNQLTDAEKSAGWRLLFDGHSTAGWRNFKKTSFPTQGWVVADGVLKHTAKGGGGDIVTDATFGDFELTWEWRVAPGGNSGVKYLITEERASAIGHEYQLIDDERHADAKLGAKRMTSAFYDVLPPHDAKPKPAGEWNSSRIVVRGEHVEHWLNGTEVLRYELGSEAVKGAVAQSKFKTVAGFGTKFKGHILLQDHGDEICFRNVKILAR